MAIQVDKAHEDIAMIDCVFCKIAAGEIPTTIVAQNEFAVAFHDRSPQAPTHLLIVPREHIININDLTDAHNSIVVGMMQLVRQLAATYGNPVDKGFNLQINTGASAGQVVFHMHWHFLAGR